MSPSPHRVLHPAMAWGVLAAAALGLAGCVTQRVEGAWKDPQAPANALRGARVLVVCDAYEPLAQRLCEERMAEAVTAQGATPILYSQSGNALPAERQPGDAQYLPAARVTAATAVLATSVTMVASDYAPSAGGMSIGIGGFSYGRSSGGGVGLSMPIGGYGGGMATGYSMNSRITDAASGRLLWTAKASATPSADVDAQLSELAQSMVAEATRAGMF